MSLRKGALTVTVEGYARSTASNAAADALFTLHIGARSFALHEGASQSFKRFCTKIPELCLAEDDTATVVIVDNDVADSEVEDADNHGCATFSLARTCAKGIDSLEIPVISTKSRKKLGDVLLSLTWLAVAPTSTSVAAEAVTANSSRYRFSSSSPSSPSAVDTSVAVGMTTAACADNGGTSTSTSRSSQPDNISPPRLFVPFTKEAEALPEIIASDQKENDVSCHDRIAELQSEEPRVATAPAAFGSPFAFAALEAEAAGPQPFATSAPDAANAGFGSPLGSVGLEVPATYPAASVTPSATATEPTSSAAVMAAMAALAAMVAAAAELPANYTSSAAACKGSSLQAGTSVSFYPRIQPYDAAPPLEFGPGVLPTSTGTKAFYPDIAVRMQISDLSMRMHELRPTLSAPLRFGAA